MYEYGVHNIPFYYPFNVHGTSSDGHFHIYVLYFNFHSVQNIV